MSYFEMLEQVCGNSCCLCRSAESPGEGLVLDVAVVVLMICPHAGDVGL